MIKVTESKLHWNYFLALERDMEQVSRFIEFSKNNFAVYSIELAHLLFAAASEVDVVAKAVCKLLDAQSPREKIPHYRAIITAHLPNLAREKVFVPRYGLELDPWSSWRTKASSAANPLWWRSYNNVKHQRSDHFNEANLKNALNALAGLLVIEFYYYRQVMILDNGNVLRNKDVTAALEPNSTLFQLSSDYYFDNLVG